jgi:ATP-dependent protease ClpP protease subunit
MLDTANRFLARALLLGLILLFVFSCQDCTAEAHGKNGVAVILRLAEITHDSPQEATRAVHMAGLLNSPEIDVILDGKGGYVEDGFEVSSELNNQPVPVKCIIRNVAMSMDAYLFEIINCRRVMGQNAMIVFHRPEIPLDRDATPERRQQVAEEENDIQNKLCLLVSAASKGKVKTEECEDHLNRGLQGLWGLDADAALELGLVDEVLPY